MTSQPSVMTHTLTPNGKLQKTTSIILGKDVSISSLSSHFPSFDKTQEKTETERALSYGTEAIINKSSHR